MKVVSDRCPSPEELSRAQAEGAPEPLRAHLESCAACAQVWEADLRAGAAACSLPARVPAPEQSARIKELLLASARAPRRDRRWARVVVAGTLCAASAAAGVVIGARFLVAPRVAVSPPAPSYRGTVAAKGVARFVRLSAAPDEVVRLLDGTVTVEVTPLQPGERFRVVAGDGEVEVRGTAFTVEAAGDHLAAVRVAHGRVEVRSGERPPVMLVGGESWGAPPAAANPAPALGAPPAVPVVPRPRGAAPAARPVPRAAPARAMASAPPEDPTRPVARAFQEGWSALSAGRASAAAQSFDRALRADPRDPLAEDASFWAGVALSRAGDSGGAMAALSRFVADYPTSVRFGEASAMLGWLLVDAGELDRAERSFRAAEADRVDSVRASARKGLEAVAARRRNRP